MATDTVGDLKKEIRRLRGQLSQKQKTIEEMKMNSIFTQTLFDGINEEIVVIDENFLLRDANREFLSRHGVKKSDVLGKECHRVVYGLNEPCVLQGQTCPLERARETGTRVEVTHLQETEAGELKEWIRIVYPLIEEGKQPKQYVEISRDVTEYRNLIKRLQGSEKKFRTILDTATDAILSINEDHEIILFNNAAERIFGYTRPEVLGRSLNLLIPRQYGDHYRFVKRFLETREPQVIGKTLSLTALRKSGEEFPIELGLSQLELEGEATFTAIIRDVSGQRQLERKLLQSERLAAVGQTVAHVAHEIKNPLMIIGGFSHQIKRNVSDPKTAQKCDLVLDEVARLERLVASLGDFTREYRLMKRSASINSVILDVLNIVSEIYPADKYEFVSDLAPDLQEINCDPDKLKQVFINLIANGIEAMSGGGRITVETVKRAEGVEVLITDEGVGINQKDLDHIFEPFYTTREGGSGLGLSISYKIVEAHGGEIRAYSSPGRGTTFSVKLASG